jgi:hypothetical protein
MASGVTIRKTTCDRGGYTTPPSTGGGSSSSGSSGSSGSGNGEGPSGTGPTGISVRETLVVTSSTLLFVGARGPSASLPADAMRGFTYTVSGTSLKTVASCPTAGAEKTIPFSVVGGALVLFPDTQHREVYGPR